MRQVWFASSSGLLSLPLVAETAAGSEFVLESGSHLEMTSASRTLAVRACLSDLCSDGPKGVATDTDSDLPDSRVRLAIEAPRSFPSVIIFSNLEVVEEALDGTDALC